MKHDDMQAVSVFIDNQPNHAVVRINRWGGKTLADCGEATAENMERAVLFAAAPELADALALFLRARKDGGEIALAMAADAAESALYKAGVCL